VRFFRWATDRLEGRDGIVCFITNNNFVDSEAFVGMRKHLSSDFDAIFHIDLHGNVRQNPTLSGTTHNVFGIQVGVGVTVAIRHRERSRPPGSGDVRFARVPETWRKEDKLGWLVSQERFGNVDFVEVNYRQQGGAWIMSATHAAYSEYPPLGSKDTKSRKQDGGAIFQTYSLGVKSNRDDIVYDFQSEPLLERMRSFTRMYNAALDALRREGSSTDLDEFVLKYPISWDGSLKDRLLAFQQAHPSDSCERNSLYRPFTKKRLFFYSLFLNRQYLQRRIFPTPGVDNFAICCTNHTQIPFVAQITNNIVNEAVGGRAGQCFPYYIYNEDGTNRRENITDWALKQFREHYKDKKIDKWAIFYYVYGVLHHPGYREKFADNLKRELPRIPFAPDFKAFAKAGKKLAGLHLDYEQLKPWDLNFVETRGVPLSYRVDEKMRLSKDKLSLKVNPSLTLAGIPPAAFEYRLGNRSALDWVIDQYQVSTDKRSGITSDPNRDDDPEYIVRLVGQVIRVSMETVAIVNALPDYAEKGK
jgi:predicted helicase